MSDAVGAPLIRLVNPTLNSKLHTSPVLCPMQSVESPVDAPSALLVLRPPDDCLIAYIA